ncbi:aromatase/cyclase [Streptomyces sp. NPDC056049]|uniref:aromatase/cyclase n=1 Tax=Streptomyces sp. NPDC056049 TaxID=3345693 RepID=UPI0035DC1ECB
MAPTTAHTTAGLHTTEHTIAVDAPPSAVFALVADVTLWPQVFGPTVHVEVLEEDGAEQLLRIWALAHGQVRSWTSRRILDERAGTVSFRQVVSAAPVASMGGEWRIGPDDHGGSRVVLLHDYRAVDDDPAAVRLIGDAVDHNSRSELDALRRCAEAAPDGELRFTFSDSVDIAGDAADVFAFLDRADLWPRRLPHVARLALVEPEPGIQQMDMDTRAADGSTHTTRSVRVCFAERNLIVYKQLLTPPVMSGHTGRWVIESLPVPAGSGDVTPTVRATSWHTVTLDPEGVRKALGPQGSLAEARALVRKALGTNSSHTLRLAREFAEAARAGA